MIHINKYIALSASILAMACTSCDDFLTIKPLNDIVADNFWTEKADVESALNACYAQMESTDVVQRMFVWGEVRSDNVYFNSSAGMDLQRVVEETIFETNSWSDWVSFYQVINRCNTVIYYAPSVAEIDPNLTPSEVKATIAEATFLRTLAYFYLMRTFQDVPYTTKPSIDDNDVDGDYRLVPTKFYDLLPQLISDLEAVKGDALKLFPESATTGRAANTSRVTTCAIYALLADLYLWNKEYQKCVDYCDLVLAYKMERYTELKQEYPDEADKLKLFREKYPLILEQRSGNTLGAVYNEIFGEGNSFESIFELYYRNNMSTQNNLVYNFFGNRNTSIGQCLATSELVTDLTDNTNSVFRSTDCRIYENYQENSNQYCIRKYVNQSVSLTQDKSGANASYRASQSMRSDAYANWIIYRLTDVMLMKAEAEIELDDEQHLEDAFDIISVVYNRGNNFIAATADTLVRTDYATQKSLRGLVFNERRRELLFEGKRWYDLLRLTLRTGDKGDLVNAVVKKQKKNQNTIRIKLQQEGALFWPYLKREIDANPNLSQNPAYYGNDTSEK